MLQARNYTLTKDTVSFGSVWIIQNDLQLSDRFNSSVHKIVAVKNSNNQVKIPQNKCVSS